MIELLHADCMEYMAGLPDKAFDLAIVDPPYRDSKDNAPTKHMREKQGDMKRWENKPDAAYFSELFRVSINQIVWGSNNFELPPTSGFIFWNKHNSTKNYSDGELAWTSFSVVARCFDYAWGGLSDGIVGRNKTEKHIHPTQKPIALYNWLLTHYAKPGQRILDTHLGSGSSAIAAHNLGFDFVGTELDADYYAAAVKRFEAHKAQATLFQPDDYAQTQTQENLL